MKIMHISESLVGGPASYLSEILPYQIETFGRKNVSLVFPAEHASQLNVPDLKCFSFKRSHRGPEALVRFAISAFQAIGTERPDVVHLHSTFAGIIGRLIKPFQPHPKYIYCSHCWSFDKDRESNIKPVYLFIEYLLQFLSDAIVSISPHETEMLKEFGFGPKKIREIVSGVGELSTNFEKFREERDEGDAIKLLFVGRLDRQKGFDLLFEAMKNADTGVRLDVIGAPFFGTTSYASTDNVTFLGWKAREELVEMLSTYDALVMPSRWEGMPLAALEALRAGLPIIGPERGPFPYIIGKNEAGILVDPQDPCFIQKLTRSFSIKDFRILGSQAFRRQREKFSAERMNIEIVKLYNEICKI